MPQALLSARGITCAIGPRTILDDVTLDVDDGARVGLIGPNGSGKSTLMRVLAGAETPDAGRVVLDRAAADAGLDPALLARSSCELSGGQRARARAGADAGGRRA
jgi:ABC-type cobalamin/Fe3+-siderophores transport system ATPase subunit